MYTVPQHTHISLGLIHLPGKYCTGKPVGNLFPSSCILYYRDNNSSNTYCRWHHPPVSKYRDKVQKESAS